MPRQRKAQNGAQRIGTGRVANTTTGSTTTQAVYRIPTGKRYGECDVLAYEVLGTSPISVAIEWENIYRISLDMSALESAIEDMNLDLSNVTLQTVNGNVEFTGNITADWTFTWTTVTADTVTATTWNITNVTSSSTTTASLTTDDASIGELDVTGPTNITNTLTVTWAITGNDTLSIAWNSAMGWDLSVVWDVSASWVSATTWDITTLTSTSVTTDTLSVTDAATVGNGLTVTGWTTTDTLTTSWDATIGWDIAVTWTSAFTGDVTVDNITSTGTANLNDVIVGWNETIAWTMAVTWATTLNNTLTVAWASTLSGNASVGGNLSVAGNSTVTGNQTVTWDAIFSDDVSIAKNLNVSGDTTLTDDLTVNGTTHLKWLETVGSVDITWTLRTSGAAVIGNGITVTGQVESDTVRTWEVVADEIRATTWIYLSQWGEAPDFVLQSEKGQPNGVAPLDVNGLIDSQYLPPVYTSAIVKMGTGVFSNSDTSVVVDADITSDSFVVISNYQDIVWDLNETISVWQITVVSNHTETWSYKYIIVNSLS